MKKLTLLDRATKQDREARELAPFAMHSADSAGRHHAEQEDVLRTGFERDRDRIVHSTAFRRLMYKTQVFVNWEGDHNRTRLSHSLEVCQVARSVGSALRLNEPLCEALSLAHDIGHPPFGHRGESALNEIMKDHGGFRHNAQVLRVVDRLERRTPDSPGLNLTREVRESLLKHEDEADWPAEFAPRPRRPLLEGQVVDLGDSTAYNKHDLEDGLLAAMFTEEDVTAGVELWRDAAERVGHRHPGLLDADADRKLRIFRIANEVIGICIGDLISASAERIAEAGVGSAREVRKHDRMLIGHGPLLRPKVAELQGFLYRSFYRNEHLQRLRQYSQEILGTLFEAYRNDPRELSQWYRAWADEVGVERAICDYLAGMTDRFAEQEYERLRGEGANLESLRAAP